MNIAALEDHPDEARLIAQILSDAGHTCTLFSTGTALLADLKKNTYDLLLLDWLLPDMTGYDVLNAVRNTLDSQVLVLFLSNQDLEENIVAGLMAGGDDYMVKPVRRAELLARIHSMSRRLPVYANAGTAVTDQQMLEIGPYRLDKIMKSAEVHGEEVDLKPKEFDIALILLQNPGAIVSRETIMDHVWGHQLLMTSRTLDTHISQVRRKLRFKPENGVKLSTVYTLGYRLDFL